VRHRPEYINASAPYVRPALYVPPAAVVAALAEHDEAALANPISRWAASWRSVVYLFGVLAALALLIGGFAYGVKTIAASNGGPTSSTWVTPSTYGPPVGTPR
jgi:hypothetical protein